MVNDYSRSALSIHHLANEDKHLLFHKIYATLAPGGLFVNADQAEGETLFFRQRYLDNWNEFLRSGPPNETKHVEILRRRHWLDKNEILSLQLSWLHECGFSDVDLVYKNHTFIVTVAKKG